MSWKELAVSELNPVEIFFDTTFNNFVFRFRYLIIIVCTLMAAYASVRSTEVQGLSTMEQFFELDHIVS